MGGTVLIPSTTSIAGARRSRGIAAALAGGVMLFLAHLAADCGDIHEDHRGRAWREQVAVRAW